MSAAKKKDLSQIDSFIVHGTAELARQTPAQRGILIPDEEYHEEPKENKSFENQNEPKQMKEYEQPKEQKYPKKNKHQEEPEEPKVPKRERWCVNLDSIVIKWAKRAAYHTPGLTLSDLVEHALIKELKAMEKERGEPFPPGGKVKVGRPMKM